MSPSLSIHLLGDATLLLHDKPIEGVSSQKAKALFFYVACQPRPVARDVLADLFFGDRPTDQAASNLRTLLARLKPIADYLNVERHTVGFNRTAPHTLDVYIFAEGVTAGLDASTFDHAVAHRLETTLALYQGDFLAGFHLNDARVWEEWLLVERERWQHLAIEGYNRFVTYCLDSGHHERGITAARRLLHLDPLREESYRQLMTLLARDNQRLAALALYEQCRLVLAEEMGVDPAPDTTALHERVLTLELQDSTAPTPPRAVRPHNLTRPLTPFIGRHDERTLLRERLALSECRLLTVTGAGGMGKSRLALSAAWDAATDSGTAFTHGVFWVALAGVDAATNVPIAIAEAVGLELQGKAPPDAQLCTFLSEKSLLLVLDNLEQILESAQGLVALLQAAPEVKILATSRERLHVQPEWVLTIEGLPSPADSDTDMPEEGEACQLFLQHTRRVRPDYALTPADHPQLIRLCRLLAGMPLGLELAATWMAHLSLAELVGELERDLDVLTVPLRDVPDRHRSLRAVFEQSWRRLTPEEQGLFARLSLFRGGFTREAAERVADATLILLLSLEQKSLLRRDRAGRYDMQELVRQFAMEKLAEEGDTQAGHRRHADYFTRWVERQTPRLRGQDVVAAADTLRNDLDNIRVAWQQTLIAADCDAIARAMEGLCRFFTIRAWYREGADTIAAAVAVVEGVPDRTAAEERTYGLLLAYQGKCLEITDIDVAQPLYEQSLTHLQRWGETTDRAFPLTGLGYLAQLHGQYAQSDSHLQAALALYRAGNDRYGEAVVLNHLCQTAYRRGHLAAAKALGLESVATRRSIGDVLGFASSLINLGLVLCQIGEYEEGEIAFTEALTTFRTLNLRVGMANALNGLAQTSFARADMAQAIGYVRESLGVYRDIGDVWGGGLALNNLGFLANEQGRYDDARRVLEEAITIFRKHSIRSGLTGALRNLGTTYREQQAYPTAQRYYQESLQVAHESGSLSYALQAIVHYARLLWCMGAHETSVAFLAFARTQPALRHEDRERAEAWLASQTAQLSPSIATAATTRGAALTLDAVKSFLLDPPPVM